MLKACELVFIDRKARVRAIREFGPAVAGLGLKGGGGRIDGKISVAIGTIAIQVHITLHEKSLATGIGILQLKDCLAIVEVMTGENQVQTVEPFAQILDLVLVEFVKGGRDARRIDEPCHFAEDFRELRVILGEVFHSAAGMRQFRRESDLNFVAFVLVALDRGRFFALWRFEFAEESNSIEELGDIHGLARDRRGGRRRR